MHECFIGSSSIGKMIKYEVVEVSMLELFDTDNYFDISKAWKKLGYQPRVVLN